MAELAYSVVETAKKLGCGKDAVYAMVENNQIPYIRTGARRVIIPKAALEMWLEASAFENVKQYPKAGSTNLSFIRMQTLGPVKHPPLKPGCGGRKKKRTAQKD